jgi:hypothetical protein
MPRLRERWTSSDPQLGHFNISRRATSGGIEAVAPGIIGYIVSDFSTKTHENALRFYAALSSERAVLCVVLFPFGGVASELRIGGRAVHFDPQKRSGAILCKKRIYRFQNPSFQARHCLRDSGF